MEESFVLGLLLFLLGHLGYIATFLLDFQWRPRRLWIVALIVIYAAGMAMLFAPFLGELLIPVYCYMAVLAMMCIIATQRKSTNNFVIYGALLFLASDSVLACNMFVSPMAGQDYVVMFTYYGAQFFILYGFLKYKYSKSA
ncbi:MAG: lysoplasmalogenase [Chloroflexi bacterium]|nr:lysoplasmalogenase [Chloroflexota bacterium]